MQVVAEPLFASAHQALMFAYTFSETQYGRAAAAEQAIAAFGRSRYEVSERGLSRGLTGLDGAAQAAMVKAIVGRQAVGTRACIEARFATMAPHLRARAMRELMAHCADVCEDDLPPVVLSAFVQRFYGATVQFVHLAERSGVKIGRMIHQWKKFRSALREAERQAMGCVEIALERAGIIAMQVEADVLAEA